MNKQTYKYILYAIFIIILYYLFIKLINIKCTSEFYTGSDPIIHIILTRYKENDISKLLIPFVNKKNIIIYIFNKEKDKPNGIPDNANNINIINIPNLGWDSYAYLYHIINNYNNLPDYIVNLHASAQYLDHKLTVHNQIKDVILNINNSKNNNIKYYGGTVSETLLDFRLDNWQATLDSNKSYTNVYKPSKIYPLNNWLLSKLGKIPDSSIHNNNLLCNYFGMFIVHKSRILKFSESFYRNILEEISVWQSEVNHYLERSWYTFYNDE